MSTATPKRYLLYCTRLNGSEKPEEELLDAYGSFLKAALAINEMAETAVNLNPNRWSSRSDYLKDQKVRVYDTLTSENILIEQ